MPLRFIQGSHFFINVFLFLIDICYHMYWGVQCNSPVPLHFME